MNDLEITLTWPATVPIARDIIRRAIPEDAVMDLPIGMMAAVADEIHAEQMLYERRGTCSGNCTADCLRTNQDGNTVCRWTMRPCHTMEITDDLYLMGFINSR